MHEFSDLTKRRYTIVYRNVPETLFTDISRETMLHRRHRRDLRPSSLNLALQPPRRHGDSNIKRVLRADRARDVPAHDVERGAVRRRGDHHGQPALDGDAAVEAEQLHGDLALVVVHGDDAVVLAPLQEDGVAGEGAVDLYPLLPRGPDRGSYVVDLVAPEVATLAVVGV